MIKILVPLDGSPAAEAAIPHAVAIACAFSAEVELLGVVDEPGGMFATPVNSLDWQLSKLQTEVYLSRTADTLEDRGLKVGWELREGDPAQAILQHVRASDIDILVMTRYGTGDARQFRLGGTVQKVLSTSANSILLVDPAAHFDPEGGYAKVVAAIDGSQCSEWASAFAAMTAQAFEGSLQVLRVVEAPVLPGGTPLTAETRRFLEHIKRIAKSQASLQLHNILSTIPPNVVTSSSIVSSDDVVNTIERAAAASDADIVIMAAEDAQVNGSGYGSVCDVLLARARFPLLVLRSEAAALSASHFRSVYLDDTEARADAV